MAELAKSQGGACASDVTLLKSDGVCIQMVQNVRKTCHLNGLQPIPKFKQIFLFSKCMKTVVVCWYQIFRRPPLTNLQQSRVSDTLTFHNKSPFR